MSIDIENMSHDELDQHAMEQLVFDSNEMSPLLKGHIFVERVLEALIARSLVNPEAFFKNRVAFELKVDLARALGVLPEVYVSAFKALNNVRNNYAHKEAYEVSIAELNSFKFDWVDTQNQAFKVASEQGVAEAARIATIFLCWKAQLLIKPNDA